MHHLESGFYASTLKHLLRSSPDKQLSIYKDTTLPHSMKLM